MKFLETKLKGAYVVELEKREDDRGFFARTWCKNELEAIGLNASAVQMNMSRSNKIGTLRGMHYQALPFGETKLIRVTKGKVFDVIIDLRPESETYKQWFGVELSDENYKMLFVPEMFAHGFVTLTDDVEVTYLVTQFYTPEAERAVRYNDPQFAIVWPVPITSVSDKDANVEDYMEEIK